MNQKACRFAKKTERPPQSASSRRKSISAKRIVEAVGISIIPEAVAAIPITNKALPMECLIAVNTGYKSSKINHECPETSGFGHEIEIINGLHGQ